MRFQLVIHRTNKLDFGIIKRVKNNKTNDIKGRSLSNQTQPKQFMTQLKKALNKEMDGGVSALGLLMVFVAILAATFLLKSEVPSIAAGGGGGGGGTVYEKWGCPLQITDSHYITCDFSCKSSILGVHHPSTDLAAACGDIVYASIRGTVYALDVSHCGTGVKIVGKAGTVFEGYTVIMCHLKDRSFIGREVGPYSAIGHVGNTGTSSGCHLHYQLCDEYSDPNVWPYTCAETGEPAIPAGRRNPCPLLQGDVQQTCEIGC